MKLLLRYVHTAIKIGTGIASNVQISFVFFQEVGFLFPTFWWTTLPRDSFGLNLHTVKSATVTKTRRCSSRRMPWNNWEHTCPSLSWDFIAVNKKERTIHVTTVANSSGEAVVQYFSGKTDSRPLGYCCHRDEHWSTYSCYLLYILTGIQTRPRQQSSE